MSPIPQTLKPKRRVSVCPHTARVCKIVTFYEDFEAGMRAFRFFDSVARAFSGDLPVNATSWSFSMLGMSRLTAAVLRDSPSADVLVVAAHGVKDLPPHVAMWVDRCISREPNAEPVLVALTDDELEADGSATPLCSSLMRIADRRHATFVRTADLARCVPEFPPEPVRDGRENADSELGLARFPAIKHPRRWGIND
jgi:hypothetical protein